MQHLKATAWGAGLMGMAGLAGALLGPSPLVLPLAPLVGIAYAPFMLATAALGIPCQTCAERFAESDGRQKNRSGRRSDAHAGLNWP